MGVTSALASRSQKQEEVTLGGHKEMRGADNRIEVQMLYANGELSSNTQHYRDFLACIPALCTEDNRAMTWHILSHTDIYQKPSDLRHALARIFGEGLLIAERGFNYQLDALDPASPLNEFNEAFKNLLNAAPEGSHFTLLQVLLPILQHIVIMASEGMKLLADTKVNAAVDKKWKMIF
ncbi:hypothetical protein FIBSPDRAFT_1037949 [Athelia psychrophila]|uniref:Uncharacterized protein n=1 Tax=Athelia psychrophila TaxID=1759441 RepID=A0A166TJ61_9AGAM|nr:hypothetical protein FIBSPDRAFT_1037949 [Fibularhizoctonia sp. CBS 109695]